MAYGGRALKTAMKAADASGARIALVLGDRELEDGTVMVRDLTTGEQNPCPDRRAGRGAGDPDLVEISPTAP